LLRHGQSQVALIALFGCDVVVRMSRRAKIEDVMT
jgi:hypothetical protein